MRNITLADFAHYFEVTPDTVPEQVAADLARLNTRYREADKEELEAYIDYFMKKITKKTARRSIKDNLELFERGWAENLEEAKEHLAVETLRPKYYQNLPPYYLGPDGRMYFCENREMSIDILALYVKYLFLKFFADFESVHEFGSGSGQNLLTMTSVSPPIYLVTTGPSPASGWPI